MKIISNLPNTGTATTGRPNGVLNDASTPGAGDGTPAREDWLNDIYYALLAVMDKAGISADDSDEEFDAGEGSQFADAVVSLANAYVNSHAALTTAHGAVSEATASRIVIRDANGRAQFANPSASADAATKSYVDSQISGHDSQHDDRFVRPSGSGFADGEIGLFADATGRLIKTANMTLSGSGTMGSSTSVVPSEARIRSYLNSLTTSVKNEVWPVGSSYVQLPGASAPGSLGLPGTWTAQFESEGIFFRTPGGNASAFNGGIQGDRIRNITATFTGGRADRTTVAGAVSVDHTTINSGGGDVYGNTYTFDSSAVVPTGPENNPRNRTWRVWKRTA
jgi:hypothetical protein